MPFANANGVHIPLNFNLSSAVDVGTVNFATYKATANAPLPPTVNHFNAAGQTQRNFTGNITGGTTFTMVTGGAPNGAFPTAVLIGDIITGPGIPAGTVATAVTATTITLSNTSTNAAGIAVVSGTNFAPGANNDFYGAERFWLLSKTGSDLLAPPTTLQFTFAFDERPLPTVVSPYIATLPTFGTFKLTGQPWYVQTTPTLQGQWRKLVVSPTAGFNVTALPITQNFTVTGQNFNISLPNFNWNLGNSNPWAITMPNQPLPIELLSFDANLKGEDVQLDWNTASERDNDFFTVERTLNFEHSIDVAQLSSHGNSNTIQKYTTWDQEPVKGKINYYRLRQTDKDGTTKVVSEYVSG